VLTGVFGRLPMDMSETLGLPSEQGHKPLPEWAKFLVKSGEIFADSISDKSRVVYAMALPDTRFAAALVTTGIIAKRAASVGFKDSPQDYFKSLQLLPPGTEVLLETGGIYKKARTLPATDYRDRQERIRLQLTRQAMIINIPAETSHRITLDESGVVVKSGTISKEFLDRVLGVEAAQTFLFTSSFDCLVSSELNALRDEVVTTQFSVSQQGQALGNLQDLIRVKRFTLRVTPFFRSNVESPRSKKRDANEPLCVVFRDSYSFSKTWARYLKSHWVILLGK
jgi:hypothetical protein